jgi:hypothetical protein
MPKTKVGEFFKLYNIALGLKFKNVAEPVELFRLKCAIDRRTNSYQLNALQTEQSFGLSGLRPIQPRFSRIEAGLSRTKASSHHRIAHQNLIYIKHTLLQTSFKDR